MNDLMIFNNPEFGEIRTVGLDGEPLLVGKDVALALGYTNPQKAIRDHVDDEDKTVNETFSVNGTPIVLINESGLYSLVLSSKLPGAVSLIVSLAARLFWRTPLSSFDRRAKS